METCKACRWWAGNSEEKRDYRDEFENVRICLSPRLHFIEGHERIDEQRVAAAKGDPAHVLDSEEAGTQDGSGYWSALFTGPDFGCIHHEPLSPEPPSV